MPYKREGLKAKINHKGISLFFVIFVVQLFFPSVLVGYFLDYDSRAVGV